jgi:predicted nucleotidyltransferase
MKTLEIITIEGLKEAVVEFLKGENVRVFLFGSRARRDHAAASDADIGVVPGAGFHKEKLVLLREFLEGLNIPYKVELVDFSEVSEQFRAEALKDAVFWKE